jgi:hypothetical protein
MIDVSLDFETVGIADLSERGAENTYGGFNSIALLSDKAVSDMELCVRLTDREDAEEENIKGTVQIKLSCYHVPTEGKERHFHPGLEIFLDRRETEELQNFLAFLLSTGRINKGA